MVLWFRSRFFQTTNSAMMIRQLVMRKNQQTDKMINIILIRGIT